MVPSPYGDVREYVPTCAGWGPGNRDTELHSLGAGGEQAAVEDHKGMARDSRVRGVQGLVGRSAGHPLLGGGGMVLCTIADTGGTQVSEKVSTAMQFEQRTSVDVLL